MLAALPDNLRDSVRHAARDGLTALGMPAARSGNPVGEAFATLGEQTGDAPRSTREHLPARPAPSPLERIGDGARAMGLSEKTVAVFAATFLATSFSGYLRWRGEGEGGRGRVKAQGAIPVA